MVKDYRNGGIGQSPEMNYLDEKHEKKTRATNRRFARQLKELRLRVNDVVQEVADLAETAPSLEHEFSGVVQSLGRAKTILFAMEQAHGERKMDPSVIESAAAALNRGTLEGDYIPADVPPGSIAEKLVGRRFTVQVAQAPDGRTFAKVEPNDPGRVAEKTARHVHQAGMGAASFLRSVQQYPDPVGTPDPKPALRDLAKRAKSAVVRFNRNAPSAVQGLRARILRRSPKTQRLTVVLIDGRGAYKAGQEVSAERSEVDPT